MAKTKTAQAAGRTWHMLKPSSDVNSVRAILVFSHSWEAGPPPNFRQAAVEKYVGDWMQTDASYLAHEALEARAQETIVELAAAQQQLVEARERVAVTLVCTTDEVRTAEERVAAAQANIKTLTERQEMIQRQKPVYWRAAFASYAKLSQGVAAQEMAATKPALEAAILELETVISPLIDRVFAAQRDYESAGRGFRPAEEVIGRDPGTPWQKEGDSPVVPLPILSDNRLPDHLRTVTGPEPSRSPDPVFPTGWGNKPWYIS